MAKKRLTDEELKQVNHLVLKKAHVPLRICLKLAFKNMWKKKFRYLLMFVICAISLTFLSITIELNVDNEFVRENVYTMIENGYQYTNIYAHKEATDEEIAEDKYAKYNYEELSSEDLANLKSSVNDINVHEYAVANIPYLTKDTENTNYFYTGKINNVFKYDPTNNYTLVTGRLPKENTKEILVTDYLISAFDYFNLYPTCNTVYDYLGKHLNLANQLDYTIVGIVQTNYEKWTKFVTTDYIELSDKENYPYTNDVIFMSSVFINETYYNMEKSGVSKTIEFYNKSVGSIGSAIGRWSVKDNVNFDIIGISNCSYDSGSVLDARTNSNYFVYNANSNYDISSIIRTNENYYQLTFNQKSSTDEAVKLYYCTSNLKPRTYTTEMVFESNIDAKITINDQVYDVKNGTNTILLTNTLDTTTYIEYDIMFGTEDSTIQNMKFKLTSLKLQYSISYGFNDTFDETTNAAFGLVTNNISLIKSNVDNKTGKITYYGRNVQNDGEIVIPYSWITTLYPYKWTTTNSSNMSWEARRYNFAVWNQLNGSKITLEFTDKSGTNIKYSKEFTIVGISDTTQTVASQKNSMVAQISLNDYQEAFYSFNDFTPNVLVELPTNREQALELFNRAYDNGYVIDVWAYRQDIDAYEPDPFITLVSKAGLFVFAAFTMGIMWTIISIEIVDSKKEIGILRSIGLSGAKVAFIFIFQCALVIFLSYFLGVYAAYRIIPTFNNGIMDEYKKITLYIYSFTNRTPIYLAIFVLVMTFISTIIPLIKILSHKIIDVINERDN